MRLAIIGVAHHHIDAYLAALGADESIECIGFYERDSELAETYEGHGGLRGFAARDKLLAQRPDGVIICSANAHHTEDIIAAAAHKLPILCEKPLATTIDDCRRQQSALKKSGAFLMPAHPMRFSDTVNRAAKSIAGGGYGRLLGGSATNRGQVPINHREWFIDPILAGGGAIIDHTVHVADILRLLTGSEVTGVTARANSHLLQGKGIAVESAALLALRFADGSTFSLDCSWSRPQNFPTWGGLTMRLVCESGIIEVDPFAEHSHLYGAPRAHHLYTPWGEDAIGAMICEFTTCVRTGRVPRVGFSDGLAVQEIIDAAYRSVREGTEVLLT